jgi:hypothetical protein
MAHLFLFHATSSHLPLGAQSGVSPTGLVLRLKYCTNTHLSHAHHMLSPSHPP